MSHPLHRARFFWSSQLNLLSTRFSCCFSMLQRQGTQRLQEVTWALQGPSDKHGPRIPGKVATFSNRPNCVYTWGTASLSLSHDLPLTNLPVSEARFYITVCPDQKLDISTIKYGDIRLKDWHKTQNFGIAHSIHIYIYTIWYKVRPPQL